jgi:uncharacterized membrane protein
MNTLTNSRARPAGPWLALALSTVLNLFLLGVIAGHFLGRRGPPELAMTPMARALERAEAVLSPADAAAFRAAFDRDGPRFSQSAEQVTAARHALARQIAAVPFDPRATSQALAAWRTSWDRFAGDLSGPLIDALAAISPEGRRRLVGAGRERRQDKPGVASPLSP